MMRIISLFALLILLCSCSLFEARRVPVQQGNHLTQAIVDRLKPGMSQTEAKKVMGTPILTNTFSPGILEYVYTMTDPSGHTEKRVTLTFKKNKLTEVTGNYTPSDP